MTDRPRASVPEGRALVPEGRSGFNRRDPDVATYPAAYRRNLVVMGAGGGPGPGPTSTRTRTRTRTLDQPRGGSVFPGSLSPRTSHFTRDVTVASNNDRQTDVCGRHFLFDTKCAILERNRTVIASLPRHAHSIRPGNLHRFNLSKELSTIHTGPPFTLGIPERNDLNMSPLILSPSALVVNNRNDRPRGNYAPSYHLQALKDNQKNQWFSDPMVGAPRSFIHRISELSSLESETVRQEKLKRMRKRSKPPS